MAGIVNALRGKLVTQRAKRSDRLPSPISRDRLDQAPPIICRSVFEETCVLANGEIVCSCGDPAGLRVYGNVFTDRIKDVYNGNRYREIRRWQLASKPDSWCPVINNRCGGRVFRATNKDDETDRTIKLLQLEPISSCNLHCLSCPIENFEIDSNYRSNRIAMLPLKVMKSIVDQLPDLEKILFYNFGEPFLHPDVVPFLQYVRRLRPDVIIQTNTNGIPLNSEIIDVIAQQVLLDRIVFSIDGATEESYSHYRVGGKFEKALNNMKKMAEAVRDSKNEKIIEIQWNYILFEWNDSAEELTKAKHIAKEIGVLIHWVLTHTEGASKRFLPGSVATELFMDENQNYGALTCELKMSDFDKNNGKALGRYQIVLESDSIRLVGKSGEKLDFNVALTNPCKSELESNVNHPFRLGFRLRSITGKNIRELTGVLLPTTKIAADCRVNVHVDLGLPIEPGNYQLLIDLVEEGITWFSDRGSQPLILDLEVN
jgi:pyruvate-formate lyase-activating enzyme